MFCLFRCIESFPYCSISDSDCLNFYLLSFLLYLDLFVIYWGPMEATFSSWILSSGLHCACDLSASNLKHKDYCFHQLLTLFVGANIDRQLESHFLSFRLASPKLKTFAGNVERIYRRYFAKKVRRFFSKIWVVIYRRKFTKKRL